MKTTVILLLSAALSAQAQASDYRLLAYDKILHGPPDQVATFDYRAKSPRVGSIFNRENCEIARSIFQRQVASLAYHCIAAQKPGGPAKPPVDLYSLSDEALMKRIKAAAAPCTL